MKLNDFLTSQRFECGLGICYFVKLGKYESVNILSKETQLFDKSFPLVYVDKEGFCVKNAETKDLRRFEFSECKLIEDAE